jgi:hypothetical protein
MDYCVRLLLAESVNSAKFHIAVIRHNFPMPAQKPTIKSARRI